MTNLDALAAHAVIDLTITIERARTLAASAPLSIRIEINNLQETLDLLKHKLRKVGARLPADLYESSE
jgi:hypothetical protein